MKFDVFSVVFMSVVAILSLTYVYIVRHKWDAKKAINLYMIAFLTGLSMIQLKAESCVIVYWISVVLITTVISVILIRQADHGKNITSKEDE